MKKMKPTNNEKGLFNLSGAELFALDSSTKDNLELMTDDEFITLLKQLSKKSKIKKTKKNDKV